MSRSLPIAALTVLALAFACVSASPASAQGIQGVRPEVHLNVGFDDFGVGFRIDIPIVPDGFLRSGAIRDELAISPGLDLMFLDYGGRCHNDHCHDRFGFWPVVMAQWNLYFTRSKWSIFPELGVAFIVGNSYRHHRHRDDDHVDFHVVPAASFGARYAFNARMSLLLRINFPAGFQVGLTF